ncbi:uncharacterized protein LOC142775241 [Rhipicephalus microplus]|uniref:uncharacterized protein LOC142775241 n=1 Tax=Rhipicephalus microplus TaxID=6941 RepID=UPI003F6B2719
MGLSPPSISVTRYLFGGCGCACLTQSPTYKNPLPMSLDAHSAYTEDEACGVSGDSAVQDDHPDRRFHVAKCWNSAGAPCCHHCEEPWATLFSRAECDRHLETSVMQAALTVKGTQHKAAFVPSNSGWLRISSVMQPKTRGVDTGERTIRKVCECGALDSAAYSFGVLTWKTATHLRDALPCVFAKAESINNPEDMAHPSCAVLMHYEQDLLKQKYSLA